MVVVGGANEARKTFSAVRPSGRRYKPDPPCRRRRAGSNLPKILQIVAKRAYPPKRSLGTFFPRNPMKLMKLFLLFIVVVGGTSLPTLAEGTGPVPTCPKYCK